MKTKKWFSDAVYDIDCKTFDIILRKIKDGL